MQPNGGTHFSVRALLPKKVEVVLEAGPGAPATVELKPEADGYYAGLVPHAAEGTRYSFRLDSEDNRRIPGHAAIALRATLTGQEKHG